MPNEVRRATSADLARLKELDTVVFGQTDLGLEPAADEEFEEGLRSGGVFVTIDEGAMIGFVHMEPIGDDSIFLASLAVHPDHRRTGIGSALLERALIEAKEERIPVSTVTSPENLAMIRLLLDHGFEATDYIDDYYGHGKHRIILDKTDDRLIRTPIDKRLLPVVSSDTVRSQLGSDGWVIQSLQRIAGRDYFQFAKVEVRDREEFKGDEFHAGMAFSGTVLAALIFLLGFSIDSANFYDDIRILLAISVTASLISMVVYANTGGDLARLESDRFVFHMETGNILSEYGGIVPLLVIVPVALMAVVNTNLARTSLGVFGTAVLIAYFLSTFSLWTRYERRWWSWILVTIITAAPVSWLLITGDLLPSVVWTAGVVSALLAAAVDLFLRSGESSPNQR